MKEQQGQNPWEYDLRMRERMLKNGSLDEKTLQKYLASLPDLSDKVDGFVTPQPALELPEVEDAPADAPEAD